MNEELTVPAGRLDGPGLLSARHWLRILAVNAVAAVIVALLLAVLGTPRSFAAVLTISLIYANVIGTPAALLLPRLARRFARHRLLWPLLLLTLLALAVAGSLLAGLIVIAVGVVPSERFWAAWFFGLRLAVPITLGIGVIMVLYERTRARLAKTTLELRTKELEAERAEKLAVEARLAALAARLQPHFLFNTLTAIAALIPEDPERAERLVGHLARLLRVALKATARHTVSLAEELGLVRAYLEIQEARFEARLRYEIEVPEALREFPVPPLALQTLVENSVRHVAEERREGAEVRVEGRLEGNRLVLRVWDDGPGFRLEAIPPGHGLDTLRGRLAALYGREAGLEATRDARGAWVRLSLPRPPATGAGR